MYAKPENKGGIDYTTQLGSTLFEFRVFVFPRRDQWRCSQGSRWIKSSLLVFGIRYFSSVEDQMATAVVKRPPNVHH